MAEALPSRVGTVHGHNHTVDDLDRAGMRGERVVDWGGSRMETGGYRGVNMTAPASAGPPPRSMPCVFDRSARRSARPGGPVLHGPPA